MSSTPSVSSSDGWTKIGKGGRAIAFPPEAAAAFGRRSGPRPPLTRGERSERAEFDSAAAAAFGRGSGRSERNDRSERPERPARAEFDSAAAAAFGSKSRQRDGPRDGPRTHGAPEFDAAAMSAFGGGSSRSRRGDGDADGFPSAFGKKKSLFEEASAMGFADAESGGYGMSALAKKRAEAARAPPPPKSYDELFPVLGAAGAPKEPAAAAAPAPAPAKGKPTFADLMRARAAAEDAEETRKEMEERDRAEAEKRERMEREHLRRLHAARYAYSSSNYTEVADEETEIDYGNKDLDYDVYGAHRSSYTAAPTDEKVAESSSDDDEEGAAGSEYGVDEAW